MYMFDVYSDVSPHPRKEVEYPVTRCAYVQSSPWNWSCATATKRGDLEVSSTSQLHRRGGGLRRPLEEIDTKVGQWTHNTQQVAIRICRRSEALRAQAKNTCCFCLQRLCCMTIFCHCPNRLRERLHDADDTRKHV